METKCLKRALLIDWIANLTLDLLDFNCCHCFILPNLSVKHFIERHTTVGCNGELKAKLDVEAHAFSKTAEEAIKAVGGNTTII